MHPHAQSSTADPAHPKPARNRLVQPLLAHLHDTELWASYLPATPRRLSLLALLGLAAVVAAVVLVRSGQAAAGMIGLGLGVLLVLPAVLAWLFVQWRWRQRSAVRSQVLDSIDWRGDETVLDVGCGNGLLLNGAALRLKSGRAVGIDLWAPHGGGGSLDLLWRNARMENVADRIEFKEADARQMPFESQTFDIVLSSGAMHHISRSQADFEQALHEIFRVLKPGGQVVIWDITHMVEACASRMKSAGMTCKLSPAGRFLGFEMGVVWGRKAG
jgi:SAM-dependent methyltransferase